MLVTRTDPPNQTRDKKRDYSYFDSCCKDDLLLHAHAISPAIQAIFYSKAQSISMVIETMISNYSLAMSTSLTTQ